MEKKVYSLRQRVKDFPDSPGVYLMKDKKGLILYVGKAVSLKKRVGSYSPASGNSLKTQLLLSHVADIDFIKTASEHDALILEAGLIKEHRPRFNVTLKDDKSFPYIKVSREELPRIFIGRRKKTETEGEFDYFGPYTSAKLLRRAVTMLRKSFPFCACRRPPKKVCLNYHLGLCAGPYQGKISKRRYHGIIKCLEDFLTKKDTDLIEELSVRMRRSSARLDFEEAARIRDRLNALSLLISLKKIDAKKIAQDADLAALGLKDQPRRIEAFDISNIQTFGAVGSMVSFFDGKPDKDNYRRFRIRSVASIDDYAMMREVLRRRYERLLREAKPLPDLVLIDGGRGHLAAAAGVLRDLGAHISIIALAKRQELVYTMDRQAPVKLPGDSGLLLLMRRVRDEAHRFALKYHRLLRKKSAFLSA